MRLHQFKTQSIKFLSARRSSSRPAWRVIAMPVAAGLAFCLLALAGSADVLASGIYSGGSTGYDVSYPQCGGTPPAPYAFGIVGVTGGRAFSQNGCLASEYVWAAAASSTAPSLYMNLNYPIGTTASQGMSGPKGPCARGDKSCQAYNYGWNAAQDAYAYAMASNAASDYWWLDIETSNSWSAKTSLNQQVIQGAIDALMGHAVTVGIYSTKRMWNTIAGSYAPGLDNWVAGATASTAASFCLSAYAFGGGRVSLVQFASEGYDADYGCP